MRILVAGATGVIGQQAVPRLQGAGHEVVGLARTSSRTTSVDAEVLTVDALDRAALTDAVQRVDADLTVNLLTAIPPTLDPKRFGEQMVLTNRLRVEATETLARAVKRGRLVTEGLAFAYDPAVAGLADEGRSLWVDGPAPFRPVVKSLLTAERATIREGGVVLRFGHLYGPGTAYSRSGSFVESLEKRQVPLVGRGESIFSFTHVDDAGSSVVAAVETDVSGVFNIVDDDPSPIAEWLPEVAAMIGARPPRRVPRAVARMVAGPWGVAYMTALAGADNGRAAQALGWRPAVPSWRDGFREELAPREASADRLAGRT
jgi:nucleoside-diphosphate-sugar epimerase